MKEGEEYFSVASAMAEFTCDMAYIDLNNILGDNKNLRKYAFCFVM